MSVNRTVFLVDDDKAVCQALSAFLGAFGYSARTFLSAEAFLEEAEEIKDAAEGVMLLDQRMTGMTGLELQTELARRGMDFPIIFITGHGDVRMTVKAIKAGATDFLEKPFSNQVLLDILSEVFSRADANKKHRKQIIELRKRHASLTSREQEVMQHVVAGMSNKKLGELLGVCDRTIEVHRSRAMKKMGAESLPDLVIKHAMCSETSR